MRRISLLIAMGWLLVFHAEAKKIQGKIVFANETKEVTFNIPVKFLTQEPNFEKLQYKVRYYDASGKKVTLRPTNAQEIQFTYKFKNIRMLSINNTLGLGSIFTNNTKIFLHLEMDGHLKLFRFYYTQNNGGMYNSATGGMTGGYSYTVENYILQKGNGELKRPRNLTFKKDMGEYFRECPKLVEMIESKDFKKGDLESIVRYYNSYCK
jgi:hypothetical protein